MKALQLRTFLALLFFSVLIFFLDGTGFLNGPKSLLQTVLLPTQYLVYSLKLSTQDSFSFLTFWKSGESRIRNLEQRNFELQSYETRFRSLEAENGELRKQLGVKPTLPKILLPAPVLGNGRYLEVGAGSNDGVKEGQVVLYLDNLVGKVIRTTPRASFVMLPMDPQAKVPVKVKLARGLSIGQYNSSIVLDRIAQTEDISVGDSVLTSGEGGGYSPDLSVGKVEKIDSSETDLFKKATISSNLDFQKLLVVFIVLDD